MRKKILVAEKSDAIRSIAESILHQNGYDVITASTVEKAKELIIISTPNMVIVGADMRDADEIYLYDSLDENKETSSIPILLIADPEGRSLPYPDEVILPRPFDPKDFLERVKLFVGGGVEEESEEKVETVEPLSMEAVDDEFLDAALGIDRIEVEDSEVMDKTNMHLKPEVKPAGSKKDLFEIHRPEDENKKEMGDSDRVESLMIRDDAPKTETEDEKEELEEKPVIDEDKPAEKADLAASSKLEISPDQYGFTEPEEADNKDGGVVDSEHDYNWFIKEMQKETTDAKKPLETFSDDDTELKTTSTSDTVDPVSFPVKEETVSDRTEPTEEPSITEGGVDGFISEFKKEVEQISSEAYDEVAPNVTEAETEASVAVEEAPEAEQSSPQSDAAEIHHFVNNLVDVLSEKLAKKIIDKIDKEELYQIIKDDLAGILDLKKQD